MEIANSAIDKMIEEQNVLNERFKNQTATREEEIVETIFIERKVTGISRTEVEELEGGKVILKRFIERKLYKVAFNKGLTIGELVRWFDTEDELFIKCSS